MTTATHPDIAVSSPWTNLAAANPALASADVCIQNKSGEQLFVVFGGANAPVTANEGLVLANHDSVTGNAANIWARCRGDGKVGVTLL